MYIKEKAGKMNSQASMDYLIAYAAVIMIIAVVFVVLLEVSTPANIVPNSCQFSSGGPTCLDSVIGINAINSNAALVLLLSNSGTYPLNSPNAIVQINGQNTSQSTCQPRYVKQGGDIICIINLTNKEGTNAQLNGKIFFSSNSCVSSQGPTCTGSIKEVSVGSFTGRTQKGATYKPNVTLTAGSNVIAANGDKDELTALISVFGHVISDATVNFSTNSLTPILSQQICNPSNTLEPCSSFTNTNANGTAATYIWSHSNTIVTVYASFFGVVANKTITFGTISIGGGSGSLSASGSASSVSAGFAPGIYEGDAEPQSADGEVNSGYANVNANDDGDAAIYVCAGAITGSPGISSNMYGNGDYGGSYTTTGEIGVDNGNSCEIGMPSDGGTIGSASIMGIDSLFIASGGGWVSEGNVVDGIASQVFTPLSPNEFDAILFSCGQGICNSFTAPSGCTEETEATGTTNEITAIYACSGLSQGTQYTASETNLGSGGESTIEIFQFAPSDSVGTTDASGYDDYICVASAGGNPRGISWYSFNPNTSASGGALGGTTAMVGDTGGNNNCNMIFSGTGAAIADIGVEGYTTSSYVTSSIGTLSYTPTTTNNMQVIGIACNGDSPCPSITHPSGCTQEQDAADDSREAAIIYLCMNQPPNVAYTFTTGSSSSTMAAYLYS